MNDREQLLTLVLTTKTAAGEGLMASLPESVRSALRSPITQYTLGGMGVGGLASVIRNLIGKPDPGMEGSAVARFLRAAALGGLAGAGVSGGAKLMGYDLPTISDESTKAVKRPGLMQALGVGLPVGATALASLLLLRQVRANRALSSRLLGKGNVMHAMRRLAKKSPEGMAKSLRHMAARVKAMPESWTTVGGASRRLKIPFTKWRIPLGRLGRIPGLAQPVKTKGHWIESTVSQMPVKTPTGWKLVPRKVWVPPQTAVGRIQSLWGQATGQSPQLIMLKRLIRQRAGSPAATEAAKFLHAMPKKAPIGKGGKKFKFDFDDWQSVDIDPGLHPMLRSRTRNLWPWVTSPAFLGSTALGTGATLWAGEE